MKKLKSNDNTIDRLSQLPDSLILKILSFLKTRYVVRTTLLSKHWKYLWITIPCLDFVACGSNTVQVRNFVNRALMLWKGTHLRKFKIWDEVYHGSLDSDMDLWILFATERKVEKLSISMNSPPKSLYECSSIRKLKLCGCDLRIDGNVQWDRLNCLKLYDGSFKEDGINQIFSSSPQLETFKCYNNEGSPNLSIRSSSLKQLSLSPGNEELSVLTIWAPNLEALKFLGEPYSEYLLTNVSSLTKVYIGFEYWSSAAIVQDALSQILPAIQHVVTVTLSAYCFKMLGVMKDKYSVSPLLNVKLLKIESGVNELSELLGLFEIFPKLKMLIIDWKLDSKDYGKPFKFIRENYIPSQALNILQSNLLQLRTVEITCYSYRDSILQFMEFMLKHATMLVKMVIRKRRKVVDSEVMFLTAQKVVSLQRSFPNVELILC